MYIFSNSFNLLIGITRAIIENGVRREPRFKIAIKAKAKHNGETRELKWKCERRQKTSETNEQNVLGAVHMHVGGSHYLFRQKTRVIYGREEWQKTQKLELTPMRK